MREQRSTMPLFLKNCRLVLALLPLATVLLIVPARHAWAQG